MLQLLLLLPGLQEAPRVRDLFGASVATIGDIDGRGQPDLAVGDPAWSDSDRDRGRVWFVSMETGLALACIEPSTPRMGFGWSLAAVGDVDGDGRGDLAIGTLGWEWAYGANPSGITVVSCQDRRALHEWPADVDTFHYVWYSLGGHPVACGVGDWDGDGCADVAVASPRHDECRGRVDVRSGKSGAVLQSFPGDGPHVGFGKSLCAIDDLDGDGRSELAIGVVSGLDDACARAIGRGSGRVEIRGSRDGSVVASLRPAIPSPVFGLSLATSGDLDGDGRTDLWVGEPLANFCATPLATPGLQVWTSRGWQPQRRVESSPKNDGFVDRRFATVLLGVGDVNGDGVGDLVATIPDSFGGELCLISGRGPILKRFHVQVDADDCSNLGMSACVVGDLDGDGAAEVVLSGAQWRGTLDGVVAVVSLKQAKTLRTLTRTSILRGMIGTSGK